MCLRRRLVALVFPALFALSGCAASTDPPAPAGFAIPPRPPGASTYQSPSAYRPPALLTPAEIAAIIAALR